MTGGLLPGKLLAMIGPVIGGMGVAVPEGIGACVPLVAFMPPLELVACVPPGAWGRVETSNFLGVLEAWRGSLRGVLEAWPVLVEWALFSRASAGVLCSA